jgi:hypothetical protein
MKTDTVASSQRYGQYQSGAATSIDVINIKRSIKFYPEMVDQSNRQGGKGWKKLASAYLNNLLSDLID